MIITKIQVHANFDVYGTLSVVLPLLSRASLVKPWCNSYLARVRGHWPRDDDEKNLVYLDIRQASGTARRVYAKDIYYFFTSFSAILTF